METILFLAHTQADGTLSKSALEALSAALDISGKMAPGAMTVGLIGDNLQRAADAVAGCGASKFLAVEGADFGVSRYGSDAAAAEALARRSGATMIIAPGTSRFARALPGVAQRLDGRIETHVSGFECDGDALKVQRWYYRKRMEATLTRTQRPWMILVDAGVFPAWEGAAGNAALEKVEVALDDDSKRTRVLGVEAPGSDAQTIRPDAELLFVAGAGWTKKQADGEIHVKDAEKLILDFLEKSKASLGSSKSLVDQSCEGEEVLTFMSHLNQVGQTGATPRHPKGLATCCHGEEPHTVGWRFINERRAISTDPNCGWAIGKTDVLYVADAFEVMARVNELLDE
jgi:electron transfer flavoprotein alpha subunit